MHIQTRPKLERRKLTWSFSSTVDAYAMISFAISTHVKILPKFPRSKLTMKPFLYINHDEIQLYQT